MEDIEQMRSRLENIESVEPLLAALRTISMGSWSNARQQSHFLSDYLLKLKDILSQISAYLTALPRNPLPDGTSRQTVLLVIGSERGLCGGFNRVLLKDMDEYLGACGTECQIWALGTRLVRYIQNSSWPLGWSAPLSVTTLPGYAFASELADRLLRRFEAYQVDRVDVLYNQPGDMNTLHPAVVQLLPLHPADIQPLGESERWPPPILETDPNELFLHIQKQFIRIRLYSCLLESAAAEHASRYQLMEDATQNAARLVEDLQQSLNISRRQKVTDEMQTLAVGAGLVRGG